MSPLPSASPPTSHQRHKRRLITSHKLALRLVLPFIFWGLAVISVNLVGYFQLKVCACVRAGRETTPGMGVLSVRGADGRRDLVDRAVSELDALAGRGWRCVQSLFSCGPAVGP